MCEGRLLGGGGMEEVVDDLAGDEEAGGCGDIGVAGGDILFVFDHGLKGFGGQLVAADALEVVDALAAQLFAEHLGEGVVLGLADVAHAERHGVELVGGAHAADEGYAQAGATADNLLFGADGVDAVDDIVVGGEVEFVGIAHAVEEFVGAHLALGVDVVDALGRHIHLILAEGTYEGDDLAVEVGDGDLVVIDEVEGSDAAAGQGFDHIATHAAHAEDGDTAAREHLHGWRAEQHAGTGKLVGHRQCVVLLHHKGKHFGPNEQIARRGEQGSRLRVES